MVRGLIWLPLLVVFVGLAWAGWNEYQKLEAYRTWAEGFDRAKYDIYSVLGQKDENLTWGKPTRQGPVNLQTFSRQQVKSIQLMVNQQATDWANPPEKGRQVAIEFQFVSGNSIQVPFTDVKLAAQWTEFLQQGWQGQT